ncbi:MAG: Fic family protein [Chitinophagales bacterium]
MAQPNEKLAESLEVLKKLQINGISSVIKSSEISRTHRERLVKTGFLKQIIQGWYVTKNPNENRGETTYWYTNYWAFCQRYLKENYNEDYTLSAEQSLLMHAGSTVIPQQLLIKSSKGINSPTNLLFDTSLYVLKSPISNKIETEEFNGVRIMTKEFSIVYSSLTMFKHNPIEVRTVLALIRDSSEILRPLLAGSHTVKAGRIAGAFRNIGRNEIADEIVKTMRSADFRVIEEDPFEYTTPSILDTRERSPYANRIRLLWSEMREAIIKNFPKAPGLPKDNKTFLKSIEDIYVTDAYHSLSIERYRVSKELIEKVRSGDWNIEKEEDRKHRDAMAARGYWQATQAVKASIEKILEGGNAGKTFRSDHRGWYQELFAPSVRVGLLNPADLAGYRTNQVYISNSMHPPRNKHALRDAMPIFIELLETEPEASVRAVLGHFIFVYIHPYMDGNGRMARFLMNTMLTSGGYPWTVIPVEKRKTYMFSLEQASVKNDIVPFSNFIADLVQKSMNGNPVAKL